ncbi:hypothetical protein HAPG_00058 [Halorubrum phage GNf2]|nr:hypothetical protein HAPG_00058 [Halorubrum phage GNf2]
MRRCNMNTELLELASHTILWGAIFGAAFGGTDGAIGGAIVAALFVAIGAVGKASSRYGLYE